jgi:cellulose synthase operon protein C
MRQPLIVLPLCGVGALLHAATPTQTFIEPVSREAPSSIANETLLHSAHMWEAHDRGDLAILALQKLVAARPDSPEALQELGELALRMGDMDIATDALKQLQARFTDSTPRRSFELEYRLTTHDRLALASLQRLVETSKYPQARAEFARLFPDGAPNGYLAIQYYQLQALMPGNWQHVREALTALSKQHVEDPRYRLALARHLLRNDATRLEGVYLLHELSKRDDLRNSDVDDPLIVALKSLGVTQAPAEVVNAYAKRHPEDDTARKLAAQVNARQLDAQRWWRNALLLIAPQSQARSDAEVQTELNLLRKQDKQLDTALRTFLALDQSPANSNAQLNAAVADWRTQGTSALQQHHYKTADLNLRIALALKQQKFEDNIALAEALQTTDRDAQSGALLATSMQLAPTSSWLFETYVRWLIRHGDADQALQLLAQKPIDKHYLARTRDVLRASALQQHAINAAPEQSLADLQEALTLTPDDVWLRYQLAKRHTQNGDTQRGRELMQHGTAPAGQENVLRYAQALYLSGIDEPHSAMTLIEAIAPAQRTADVLALQTQLRQTLLREEIDGLMEQERYADAAQLLDQAIAAQTGNRGLRIWRAELDEKLQRPQAARDRLALLVAEQPDDLETRLDYVRALTNCGDLEMAHLQLQAVQQRASRSDAQMQLAIARRFWTLDDAKETSSTLRPVLTQLPDSSEAWLLAGRSELALRSYSTARTDLLHAEQLADVDSAAQARALRFEIDARRQAVLTTGMLSRHKPGDAGISQFDSLALLSAWQIPINYEQRLTIRADAVTLDAGRLPDGDPAVPFGTTYVNNRFDYLNRTQRGVSLGVIHNTDTTNADLGVTPLGFLLPNIVGGFSWSQKIKQTDVSIGIERRAITSSVLSYGGMRDPASGEKWGGVVATSAYVQAGRYQQDFSLSGSLRASQFTGTRVPDNRFIGAHVAGDWRWLAKQHDRSWLGVAVNYWNYQRSLQDYSFGSGGYYSPSSYLSVALPLELQGERRKWSYYLRIVTAYTTSQTKRAAFFPKDAALQTRAQSEAQLRGDDEPYHGAGNGSGVSLSAALRAEYQLTQGFVLGGQAATDRSDYYHPVELTMYVRHVFGKSNATSIAVPPRPLRPYND